MKPPAGAAPLRAVDAWHCERDGTRLVLRTQTLVRRDDPNLRGHFPGQPIFPGVFVVEALCQGMTLAFPESAPELVALRSVRFTAPLLADDRLSVDAVVEPRDDGGWDADATGRRRDGTVATRVRARFAPSGAASPAAGPAARRRAATPSTGRDGRRDGGRHARDHRQVRTVLPQRHPLLLVDRVLDMEPGRSITAVKAVTGTEPAYARLADDAGPGHYRYPRSLLVESLGQTAALLWLDGAPAAADGAVLMFAAARDVLFESHALPGDVLRHHVRLESVVADTAFASGETWIGDRRVAAVRSLIATRRSVRPTELAPPGPRGGGAGTGRAGGAAPTDEAREGTG
ncbi:hypothetical protein BJF79_02425 [Actinomadura sp. CNU-125]|uniref:polyketide synthase dehydratase domain-containing protein n=1 Tax=Actinomadura sp. CNU-125 TaxID=1904961 RepID=UPI000961C31D|nr:polyketide synthase dehydratase domain-containing protein [Actinomadura sp. CNU-125]OLT19103.1 hypothetical protein BJF79_02425 [Actinomadura sp. CNU-125]